MLLYLMQLFSGRHYGKKIDSITDIKDIKSPNLSSLVEEHNPHCDYIEIALWKPMDKKIIQETMEFFFFLLPWFIRILTSPSEQFHA